MKILEVKNNLVKISYTAEDKLVLGGFVIIEDTQCPYVAQIMSLKADSGINYAIVKLLFTFDEEGVVKNYNGTVPELNASITSLSSDELLDILPIETPLKIGKLAQQKFVLSVDYSALEKNLLICSDKTENTDILLTNFAKQITEQNNKSVIFDTDSTINAENRLVFGSDFKLPLNYDSINFIYENDLNDVDPNSKAIIQDIFLEVQEYSKTVLDNFIPFDNFIAVVDSQYKELNIPELALLKSRLLKYKDENVFAQNAKEFQSLRAAIRGNMSTLLDISRADDILQKQIINYVYDEINSMDLFVYSIVKINNDNSDKKLIRNFLAQDKIYTITAAPHNYRYIYELKDRASNVIMFAPQTTQHDFGAYNIFLNKLNEDECLIFGKATQNIPLILEVQPLEVLNAPEPEPAPQEPEENIEEEADDFSEDSDSYSLNEDIEHSEPVEETEQVEEVVEPEEVADETAEVTEAVEVDAEAEVETAEELAEAPQAEIEQQVETETETETEPEQAEEFLPVEDTIPELPELEDEELIPAAAEPELAEPDLTEDFPLEDTPIQEELNEISETSISENSFEEVQEFAEIEEFEEKQTEELLPSFDDLISEEPIQDNLTENDLDYLQDINMPQEEENLQTFDELEDHLPETQEEPPAVPVYPAEELTDKAQHDGFEPGDRVSHPKYGEGVVEKMLKYGNKVLCSINFSNGRRLLDPAISHIQKL